MTRPALPQTATEYRRRICLAMNFISRNIDRELPLEEVARSASFSMFHFHRIFKAVVGETVSVFTRRLRLELAANRLISQPRTSITDIAMACGFSSSQNFAKAFHRHFEMTPSAYRKSKHGNNLSNGENALSLRAGYSADTVLENPLQPERRRTMNAEIKEMPEYHVAYVRKVGPYNKKTCGEAFTELGQWAGPKGFLETGAVLGLYWDNPEVTPSEKCRIDACVSVSKEVVTEGEVAMQVITGGPYAVCHFEVLPTGFEQAWNEAFEWLVDSGYACDDLPCYELYHNHAEDHPQGKWIFDICIPLKRH